MQRNFFCIWNVFLQKNYDHNFILTRIRVENIEKHLQYYLNRKCSLYV